MISLNRSLFLFFNPSKSSSWLHPIHRTFNTPNTLGNVKLYSTEANVKPSDKMMATLKTKFPLAKKIEVVDISGGCGSMYEIFVESVEFKGLTTVKQHRLINEILKEDIKQMHGLRIETKIPN